VRSLLRDLPVILMAKRRLRRRGFEGARPALGSPDARVREAAAEVLGDSGDCRSIDPLIARLQDPDTNVRQVAAYALGQLKAASAAEALSELLGDPEWEARLGAAQALGDIGEAGAADTLHRVAADDPVADVRVAAACSLAEVGDRRAEALLRDIGGDETSYDEMQRISALSTLAWDLGVTAPLVQAAADTTNHAVLRQDADEQLRLLRSDGRL